MTKLNLYTNYESKCEELISWEQSTNKIFRRLLVFIMSIFMNRVFGKIFKYILYSLMNMFFYFFITVIYSYCLCIKHRFQTYFLCKFGYLFTLRDVGNLSFGFLNHVFDLQLFHCTTLHSLQLKWTVGCLQFRC